VHHRKAETATELTLGMCLLASRAMASASKNKLARMARACTIFLRIRQSTISSLVIRIWPRLLRRCERGWPSSRRHTSTLYVIPPPGKALLLVLHRRSGAGTGVRSSSRRSRIPWHHSQQAEVFLGHARDTRFSGTRYRYMRAAVCHNELTVLVLGAFYSTYRCASHRLETFRLCRRRQRMNQSDNFHTFQEAP
jgi:hypothetical protein